MATLKKDIIKLLATATTIDSLAKNQVVLLTSLGTIIGDLAIEGCSDETSSALIKALLQKAEELHPETELDGNDGYIHLTNAHLLHAGGGQSSLGNIVVFMDQVIGITLGTVN